MYDTLLTVIWQFILVYLEDMAVFWKSSSEHIKHIRNVLMLLQDAGVSFKLKKGEFFSSTISYLGRAILSDQLEVSSHTVDAIRYLRAPTALTEM